MSEWLARQFSEYFLGVCVREAARREAERQFYLDLFLRAQKPLQWHTKPFAATVPAGDWYDEIWER